MATPVGHVGPIAENHRGTHAKNLDTSYLINLAYF